MRVFVNIIGSHLNTIAAEYFLSCLVKKGSAGRVSQVDHLHKIVNFSGVGECQFLRDGVLQNST